MSAWGEMRKRSSGQLKRTEDKYEDKFRTIDIVKKKYKNIGDVIWWKNYDEKNIEITQDVADEIGHIKWSPFSSNFRNTDSYYIIDHFELL